MGHAILVLPAAEADIRRNVRWMVQHVSDASAAKWHAAIYAAIAKLSHDPQRCPRAEEADDLGIDLRERLCGRWRQVFRILFTIDEETVIVHRVRHAAQDWITADDL